MSPGRGVCRLVDANADCRTIRDAGSSKATVGRVSVSCAADRDAEESRMQEELVMLEPAASRRQLGQRTSSNLVEDWWWIVSPSLRRLSP
mmetsp:Transcript_19653/g.68351  ORF Transcript_19653/g.68351 Transcript_19653/m.68351 type:complete len:90 (+) Transcript_19653:340-609(+)